MLKGRIFNLSIVLALRREVSVKIAKVYMVTLNPPPTPTTHTLTHHTVYLKEEFDEPKGVEYYGVKRRNMKKKICAVYTYHNFRSKINEQVTLSCSLSVKLRFLTHYSAQIFFL